jgi:YVTN family beta-propeller protein
MTSSEVRGRAVAIVGKYRGIAALLVAALSVVLATRLIMIVSGSSRFLVYVPSDRVVSVIDSTTNKVTATIPISPDPLDITISPNGRFAFVGGFSGAVSVIDTRTNVVTATIKVGRTPRAIAFTPDGVFAFVTDQAMNIVSVIDTAKRTVIGTPISVGNSPADIAVTRDGQSVYVVNTCGDAVTCLAGPATFAARGTVSIIDPRSRKVVDTVLVGYGSAASRSRATRLI